MKTLAALITEWENDATLIAQFGIEELGWVVRVVKGYESRYSVLRYFILRSHWVVSVDLQRGTADDAFARAAHGCGINQPFDTQS